MGVIDIVKCQYASVHLDSAFQFGKLEILCHLPHKAFHHILELDYHIFESLTEGQSHRSLNILREGSILPKHHQLLEVEMHEGQQLQVVKFGI